ncbi:cupin domain-containing protein [bacterium]|nr:cupin domain-containing protein [bacterium]
MKYREIKAVEMLDGVTMRMVIGPEEGAPHFNMRIFDVQPSMATPYHSHWWEHEVFIMEGEGIVRDEKGAQNIEAGMAILVPGDEMHQFVNTGNCVLQFMCLVPQEWLENITDRQKHRNV